MSGGAFLIILVKSFFDIIIPFVTVLLIKLYDRSSGGPDASEAIMIVLGYSLGISLILATVSYFTKKFYISDGNLIFIHGLLNRENTCVPLDRVHSLRTKKALFYRLLDMRGIVFDTLASRKAEIELILDESEWRRLISVIDNAEETETAAEGEKPEKSPLHTVNFPTRDLILAALCQNHLKGMAALGSFIAMISGALDDLPERATDSIVGYLESHVGEISPTSIQILLMLAVVYIFVLLLWLGRVLLRYSEMSMKYDANVLTFSYGLLSRSSCRFLYNKICTVWIKRNFLEKRFGFCTLMLKQALNASAEKLDDNLKLYGTDHSKFFLDWWLGQDCLNARKLVEAKSGRGVFFINFIPGLLISCVAFAILYFYDLNAWLILPVLYLLFVILKGVCAMRHSRIELTESYFIIHNGGLAEISNYVKYEDLEVVRLRKSPFTPFFHRVSIQLATPGSNFNVRSLHEDEAIRIYSLLLSKTEGIS